MNECGKLAEGVVRFSGPSGAALSEKERGDLIDD